MLEKFYFKRTFNDFDDFAVNLRKWKNVEISQIERGIFASTLKQLSTGETLLTNVTSRGKAHQNGEPPPGRTFCLLGDMGARVKMRKQQLDPNSLIVCPPGGELDVSTPSDPIKVFTISVSDELLFDLMDENDVEVFKKSISQTEKVTLPSTQIKQLRLICNNYFKWLDIFPDNIQSQTFRKEVRSNILIPLITIIITSQPSFLNSAGSLNIRRWKRIEEFINSKTNRPIKIHELCQVANIKERTLYRCFNERFGVSPNAYLKFIRLNQVRRVLKKSATKMTVIADIANDWGFWHMGDFAADYRSLFGENPSETLHQVFNTYKKCGDIFIKEIQTGFS